jgi:glycosyltransferase involved in cell wall biosynthesis
VAGTALPVYQGQIMIELKTETMLPPELSLRNPNRLLVEGWIFGDERLVNLTVVVGENPFPARYVEQIRPDVAKLYCRFPDKKWSMFSGFLVPIYLHPVSYTREFPVRLRARFANNEVFEKKLGSVVLKPWHDSQTPKIVPQELDPEGLVVIAMATYNPDRVALQRQVDSIRRQDYRNWICIVSDDASTPESIQTIKTVLGDDQRFILVENRENKGAYRNFERCLEMVPPQGAYIAMSDQDDYWYPDKLSRTVAQLTGSTQLAFCDMRIVEYDGTIISSTFWRNRKNYYLNNDLDLLTLANTVSATATVFRAELLKKALPFPELGGNLHHDKWLAIIAAASGGIAYVNAPLYDYVQHPDNVIGFCDFGRRSIVSELKSYPAYQAYRSARRNIAFPRRLRLFFGMLIDIAKEMSQFYYLHGKQIETFADAAASRGLDAESLGLIKRVSSCYGLIKMVVKIRLTKATTNNLEVRLLAGRFVNAILKTFLSRACSTLWKRFCRSQMPYRTDDMELDNS